MKKVLLILSVALAVSMSARAELFVDAVFAKLSVYTPYQMPIPWFNYVEDDSSWGEYSVYGVDVGVVWSASKDVIGVGCGGYLEYQRLIGLQVGIYNCAQCVRGVQAGIVNDTTDLCGVQLGLVNVRRGSDIPWLPLIRLGF